MRFIKSATRQIWASPCGTYRIERIGGGPTPFKVELVDGRRIGSSSHLRGAKEMAAEHAFDSRPKLHDPENVISRWV